MEGDLAERVEGSCVLQMISFTCWRSTASERHVRLRHMKFVRENCAIGPREHADPTNRSEPAAFVLEPSVAVPEAECSKVGHRVVSFEKSTGKGKR